MKRLAVFASGNGSNAEAIIQYFRESVHRVQLVVTNKPEAGVIDRAHRLDVPVLQIGNKALKGDGALADHLKNEGIDAIALAGYLKLISPEIIRAYQHKIWNIHPALLPDYGGKGMYGTHIHRKVLSDHARRTGITIHEVNERYDEGKILFQASFPVDKTWDLEAITSRIHRLEHRYYPRILELLLNLMN